MKKILFMFALLMVSVNSFSQVEIKGYFNSFGEKLAVGKGDFYYFIQAKIRNDENGYLIIPEKNGKEVCAKFGVLSEMFGSLEKEALENERGAALVKLKMPTFLFMCGDVEGESEPFTIVIADKEKGTAALCMSGEAENYFVKKEYYLSLDRENLKQLYKLLIDVVYDR